MCQTESYTDDVSYTRCGGAPTLPIRKADDGSEGNEEQAWLRRVNGGRLIHFLLDFLSALPLERDLPLVRRFDLRPKY